MRWNSKHVIVIVTVLAALWIPPAQSRETRAVLRWKNGDVFAGTLLESKSRQIRWSSPIFSEALVVDSEALESITFPAQTVQPTEAFRIGTVSGDVFTGDLVASDENTLHFTSKRCGKLRVNRDAVYSLNRRIHPNLILDGSQIVDWDVELQGPVKDSTYKAYTGDWPERDQEGFPNFSRLSPVEIGTLPAGYLDVDLPKFKERFAILFEGRIEITETGEYQFGISADEKARLLIDGKQVAQAKAEDVLLEGFDADVEAENRPKVRLGSGSHLLRVEYFDTGGHTRLNAWMSGPDSPYLSFDGINHPGWRRGPGGRPQSTRKKGSLFRKIEMPKQFEIDLELASSASPQFVLALGKDKLNATSDQSLRLETWDNELVVVQDKVFEPVMTIKEGQRNVHLRLTFDSNVGQLQVFASNGDLLASVKGIQAATGESMIHVRNRGEDLTLRRLSVYRRSSEVARPAIDSGRSRVHLIDGQVIYGRLTVAEGDACVVDHDGTRRDIDLDKVDRITSPGVKLTAMTDVAELVYTDGAVVRGRIERVNSDHVVLRTAFSDAPVTCALTGVSSLRFGPPAGEDISPSRNSDELLSVYGRLHGRLSFDLAESPLSWRPEGGVEPVRPADTGGARIERSSRVVAKASSFDEGAFPFVLHLKNGEIFPCQVSSYDKSTIGFQSPFVKRREIDAVHVKAIEFTPSKNRAPRDKLLSMTNEWLNDLLYPEQETSEAIDPVKLDRALTVPRFRRDNPPSHILVAKNGDLKRGSLLAISGQTVQFESKLRKQVVPVDRLARVVNVSQPEKEPNEPLEATTDLPGQVRVNLAGGSILVFEQTESKDGELVGRSPIYGDVAIPTKSIQSLNVGGFEEETLKSPFEEWVVRPAKEPEFSTPSPPANGLSNSEDPAASSPVAAPPLSNQSSGVGAATAIDTPADPTNSGDLAVDQKAPDLGKVHINARGRSLRFPVSINQRSGPVEYALVTDEGKTHESVFRTEAEPPHIHLGLLLLGATPAYVRQLPADPAQKLPGEPVHIDITWTEGGVEHSKPLEDFVVTTHNAARLSRGPWVYNGSVLTDNGLAAQTTGSIVSVWLDPRALINNPRPGRENDELHHANPKAFPADPAGLQMVIHVAKDKEFPARREASANSKLVSQ